MVSNERVAGLYDYLAAATRPGGGISSLNDGSWHDTTGVRGSGVGDVLAEREAFRRSVGLPPRVLPAVQVYPDAGQAFLRDRWAPGATYLTFNAAPCRSYHWHPAANSLQLEAGGRLLLADPGRFSYRDAAWSECAGPTYNHTTLNLNGWLQGEAPPRLRHRGTHGYDLVEGWYDGGYWPGRQDSGYGAGIAASHYRAVLWVRKRWVLVLDHLLCPSVAEHKPALEAVWQFTPGPLRVTPDGAQAVTGHADANLLWVAALRPAGSAVVVHEGTEAPRRGWVPEVFEQHFVPAPQLVVRVPRLEPWHTTLVTLLVPFGGEAAPGVTVEEVRDPDATSDFYHPGHGYLRLAWADGVHEELWWTRRLASSLPVLKAFETDAALVYRRRAPDGQHAAGLAVDATYLRPHSPRSRPAPGMLMW